MTNYIKCPECGVDKLQYMKTEVFCPGLRTEINNGQATTSKYEIQDQGGVTVYFHCKTCYTTLALDIVQLKDNACYCFSTKSERKREGETT